MADLLEKRSQISEELLDQLMEVFTEFNTTNIWSRVKRDDFAVKRFDQGNDSNLCCCQLTDEAKKRLSFDSTNDYADIVVKFIEPNPDEGFKLSDIVAVNTIVSEHNISPKLIFINEKCYVHEYIPSRNYGYEDDYDPEMVKQLARILAKFNSLKAPISNCSFKASQRSDDDFANGRDRITGWGDTEATGQKYLKVMDEHPEIKEKYYEEFSKIDYHTEITFANQLIAKLQSPIVFAHSDFNRGNRLVREEKDGKKRIYIIDLDVTCMNYRGADFGDYFANYRHKADFSDEGFPTDQEMELFLGEYRRECGKLLGEDFLKQPQNSLEHMIAEAKIFTLRSYIGAVFFGLMWYQEVHHTEKGEYFFNVAKNCSRGYNKLKQRFIEDGTIPAILKRN